MAVDFLSSHSLMLAEIVAGEPPVWIRWYPCAPGAQAYPGWTAFAHPVWDLPEQDALPGPRVLREPKEWRPKKYPAPPGQHYLGQPQWFLDGVPAAIVQAGGGPARCVADAIDNGGALLFSGPSRAVGGVQGAVMVGGNDVLPDAVAVAAVEGVLTDVLVGGDAVDLADVLVGGDDENPNEGDVLVGGDELSVEDLGVLVGGDELSVEDLGVLVGGDESQDLGVLVGGDELSVEDLGVLVGGDELSVEDLGVLVGGDEPEDLGVLVGGDEPEDLGVLVGGDELSVEDLGVLVGGDGAPAEDLGVLVGVLGEPPSMIDVAVSADDESEDQGGAALSGTDQFHSPIGVLVGADEVPLGIGGVLAGGADAPVDHADVLVGGGDAWVDAGDVLAGADHEEDEDMPITGEIRAFAFGNAPAGWLLCNGQAVNRTTFSDLFDAIGTTWGAGDGSTTFNVPDLMGRGPIGQGTGTGLSARTMGGSGGAETHQLTTAEIPAHTHGIRHNSDGTVTGSGIRHISSGGLGAQVTESAGGGGSHNNMPPFKVVNFSIKT